MSELPNSDWLLEPGETRPVIDGFLNEFVVIPLDIPEEEKLEIDESKSINIGNFALAPLVSPYTNLPIILNKEKALLINLDSSAVYDYEADIDFVEAITDNYINPNLN